MLSHALDSYNLVAMFVSRETRAVLHFTPRKSLRGSITAVAAQHETKSGLFRPMQHLSICHMDVQSVPALTQPVAMSPQVCQSTLQPAYATRSWLLLLYPFSLLLYPPFVQLLSCLPLSLGNLPRRYVDSVFSSTALSVRGLGVTPLKLSAEGTRYILSRRNPRALGPLNRGDEKIPRV